MKKLCSFLLALLLLCLTVSAAAPDACAAEEGGYVYITKSPSGETVSEGDDALFISRAENYTGIVWLIISPDGETVYENTEAMEHFPGLEIAGCEGEELTLVSIPYTMDGWYVQTRFLDADGDGFLTERAMITVIQGVVASPRVKMTSGGARMSTGESKTLAVEAVSPGGDEIRYQWYRSYSAARNSGEPILGATSPEYTPPEEIGQVFYFVGVWCVRGRDTSTPIYTTPVAIVYQEVEATPTPPPTPAPTSAPTPPPNRGGANPLINGGNAFATALIALAVITALAVTVTALILHALAKREDAEDPDEDDGEGPDE